MASDPNRTSEATMDAASLYREEIYTDRKVGTLRVLQPVKSDGSPDTLRRDGVPGRSAADDEHGTVADQLRHRRRRPRRCDREAIPRRRKRASSARCAKSRRCAGRRRRRSCCRRPARRSAPAVRSGAARSRCPDAGLAASRRRRDAARTRASPHDVVLQPPWRIALEAQHEEVDERAHFRRQVSPARIRGVDADRRRRVAAQQRHEPPGADVGGDDEVRLELDAHARDGKRRQHRTVVRMRVPGHLHFVHAARRHR